LVSGNPKPDSEKSVQSCGLHAAIMAAIPRGVYGKLFLLSFRLFFIFLTLIGIIFRNMTLRYAPYIPLTSTSKLLIYYTGSRRRLHMTPHHGAPLHGSAIPGPASIKV
jgi:hypothetical protein